VAKARDSPRQKKWGRRARRTASYLRAVPLRGERVAALHSLILARLRAVLEHAAIRQSSQCGRTLSKSDSEVELRKKRFQVGLVHLKVWAGSGQILGFIEGLEEAHLRNGIFFRAR
jgi:hypothetical protein